MVILSTVFYVYWCKDHYQLEFKMAAVVVQQVKKFAPEAWSAVIGMIHVQPLPG